MTAETEVRPRRRALAAARAWQALELTAELRRGVEVAAEAAGVEPEAWLTRVVLAAAHAAAPHEAELPASQEPDADVARSLATLLSAARARSRERQAEASTLTLVVPAPADGEPHEEAVREPARQIRLTAERPDEEPATQLPTLYYAPPRLGRHILALTLLTLTVGVAFGAGAFYVRYGGAPPAAQPALTAALPPSRPPSTPAPAPPSAGATGLAAAPSAAPAAAVSSPPPPQPAPPSVPPPPSAPPPKPAAIVPPPTPEPTSTASAPAKDPPSPPPPAPAAAAPAPPTAAQPSSPPAPPPAATAAALPPGVGPRVQPPPASPESVSQDYNLGVRYAFGTGVKQDYKKAAALFLKAAMQGLPDAQYNLGALYDNGLGVPKDPVRAVIWYHSAAEQHHPSAELNLGLAYANGTGVAQDYAEAARWFRRAADQGVVTAQYNLAALYANGRGVEQSNVDAYAWFNIAAAAGDLEARDQMQRAAGTMSAQQLRAARALAVKLAEGVRRPIPGSDSNAKTQAPPPGSAPRTANPNPHTASATSGASAGPSALAQPIDRTQVAEIQRYLTSLQFDPGPANGVLGDQTAEAIRKYQTDRKLKVDGEASRALLFRLKADIERQQKP